MRIPFIEDLALAHKRVLVRVDFNVPLDQELEVTDPARIEAALPTIQAILAQKGSAILMSHLGRPKGAYLPELSLKPCAKVLEKRLNQKVTCAPDCIGEEVEERARNLKPGEILLLENLRFHRAETHPDHAPDFADALARLGDCYVNDAFGCCHRTHSSIFALPQRFPGKVAMGYLVKKELDALDSLLKEPKRPFVALIGGAKVGTKLGLLKTLAQKADALLIGGGMAYTFLKAADYAIGKSLAEEKCMQEARSLLAQAKNLSLPLDLTIAQRLSEETPTQTVTIDQGVPADWEGVDIGPQTRLFFAEKLKEAKTILWNGPVGVFELEPFAEGTYALAQAIAQSDAQSVIGGGDSIAAAKKCGIAHRATHLSTGGGATLAYLETGTLPGLDVLRPTE